MPYDKKSFLSGLAAGRNARSWPRQHGDNYFLYTLTAEAGREVRSPYYVLDGWIHWGDGTVDRVNNDPGDIDVSTIGDYRYYITHTYEASGEYTCIMEGNLRSWSANDRRTLFADTYRELTSVITPFPNSMKGQPDCVQMFNGTPNLRSIPDGLLGNICESLTSAWGMFRYSGIPKIPEKFFLGCNFQAQIGAFDFTFSQSGLTEIPPDLFAYTPAVDYMDQTFTESAITSIPPGLFAPLEDLYGLRATFGGTSIESIPYNIFSNNLKMMIFDTVFDYCVSASGEAPPLWEMFPDADGYWCFHQCTNLSNYNDIPRRWGGPS
ncbi:MAG: hypothetical protein IKN89_02520 [Oscillospiraceae bacterium]|nr:hypothetical protein [Oscillospiraceae bacterium]